MPGLTILRQKIRDEENGSVKNLVMETIKINAYFDPDSMEIKLSDNKIKYWKDTHTGSLRGKLLLYRNTYILMTIFIKWLSVYLKILNLMS